MENTEKLANSKQVIAYIAERFPNCFTLEGEARPLKIGIFQDLSERLADDPRVSKTQLRAALRQYTSSWRYLYGAKEGAVRVDLDGSDCGALEQEHIEHAQTALAESKARAAERRKEQAAKQGDKKSNARDKKAPKANKSTANQAKSRPAKAKNTKLTKKPVEPRRELNAEDIVVGKDVNVNMGNGNMPATIVELNKDEVRVRLSNGLTMLVKAEHLSS
ncbi:RNA chaperone ProQ [Enterovibrio norvegicus]|uniref:RNA chaperone ProQ n=1 Tax=Enterovibrio norvegicus TaxID=188144 RepID=UPI000C843B56|nr:RNA chaperone ProQ [Enterovibrio norvegicus]PML77220.1 RNA chaperone ProQ [Enterovibrio norvegicus]PMN65624.1 RNA chaperone ProQ [Enterovibrio norvegicus]